jgi:glucose/arabinose dehydrogenase
VVLPQDYGADLARHPGAHDVPGQEVVLTGDNVDTYDVTAQYPYPVETGAFKPFGVPANRTERVAGARKCSTGVWRAQPDGTGMELLAWGVRNPYGMAFGEDGELYVSDNGFAEAGERAVANDPDRIWRIRNARTEPGSVRTPDWYGFPDICADGRPAWEERHLPQRGRPARRLIAEPPTWAGPPAYVELPHSGMANMDVCRSDLFGHRGRLFACEWGSLAPLTSPRSQDLDHGFRVIGVDVAKGTAGDFLRNRHPGPASAHGTGGVERPVDCAFSPDGRSLYVLDFGVSHVDGGRHVSYGHTGVLWRITRR